MSQIYEALLQAELERLKALSQQGKSDSPDQAQINLAVLQSVAAAAAATPEASAKKPGDSFPWERIAVREWKPSLPQLPALDRISAGAEQFRSLRSRLYEYRDFNKLKSILVSSGDPQEGKSFVAANLALSLAHQRSGRVLLIDADLRRYTLNQLLGAPVDPGLSDYLAGNADLLEIMQRPDMSHFPDEKRYASLSRLTFIPAGTGDETVVDLSTTGRFKQLMDTVEPLFDWIVVDSSPVNLVSDAVRYAHDCDGVLMVVRSGTTRYEMAQRAQAEFKSGSIIGVVLNGSPDAPRASYYGYGYGAESLKQ